MKKYIILKPIYNKLPTTFLPYNLIINITYKYIR